MDKVKLDKVNRRKHIYELTYDEWKKYHNKCNCECLKGCPFRLGGCCLGDILPPGTNRTLEDIYYDDADWLAPDIDEFEGGKEE